MALTISKPCVAQTINFRKLLLSSSQSTTQNLDALAVVVPEISSRELKLNLAFILPLSVSKPGAVQTTNFRQMLVSSSQSTTQNLNALNYILFFFYIKTNIYLTIKVDISFKESIDYYYTLHLSDLNGY